MTSSITHIQVAKGLDTPVLPGYIGLPVDVNEGAGGFYLYINYRRGDGNAITGVQILKGRDAIPPSGWTKDPHDLNGDSGGEYLYIAWKYGGGDTPLLDMILQSTTSDRQQNPFVLGDTYSKIDQDLNEGSGGKYIYLYTLRKSPVLPINPAQGIPPNWVSNPDKEFEVARAQVTRDRLLVRTLKLTIDDSQHLPPGSPFHREVVQQLGVTRSQKDAVSSEIQATAGIGFEAFSAKINASLGGTTNQSHTTEFSAHEATTITQTWDIPAVNFGREVRICHVDDVVRVYAIPNGQKVLATATNGTPYRGTFVTDQAGGFSAFR